MNSIWLGGELDLVGGELDLVGGELDLVGGELDQVQSKWGRTRHGAKPADTSLSITEQTCEKLMSIFFLQLLYNNIT